MRAPLPLRIASAISLLYFAGHTAGYPWTPGEGPQQKALVAAMRSDRFLVEGVSRTYWDFYVGFGVIISLFLLAHAVALWQLASLAREEPRRLRPILWTVLVAFGANALVAWHYFFPLPAILAAGIVASVAWALFATRGG